MYEKIVVPLDGSETAEAVLPWVERLALRTGADLILTTVAEHPHGTIVDTMAEGTMLGDEPAWAEIPKIGESSEMVEQATERVETEAKDYLHKVQEQLEKMGVRSSVAVLWGHPAENIIDYAVESGADMIAMATHGRSGIGRWVHGSVADKVLKGATVPVLLVRAFKSSG